MVRYLTININYWNKHHPNSFIRYISSHESLETLTLFLESEDPLESGAELVEHDDGDENTLWGYSEYLSSNQVLDGFEEILRRIQETYDKILEGEDHRLHDYA